MKMRVGRYTDEQLTHVYDRSSGYCHLCGKKLALSNYARVGFRGAWEVEHSHARARGGSDRLSNLYAACFKCNRDKGTISTRSARAWHGRTRAPLSCERREEARRDNALAGALVGGFVGLLGGPGGVLLGMLFGGAVGYEQNPDETAA